MSFRIFNCKNEQEKIEMCLNMLTEIFKTVEKINKGSESVVKDKKEEK